MKTKDAYSEVSLSKTSKLDNNTDLLQRLLFKVAKKWVSGNTYKNALSTAQDCNSKGVSAILNFLGEDTTSEHDNREYSKRIFLIAQSIRE